MKQQVQTSIVAVAALAAVFAAGACAHRSTTPVDTASAAAGSQVTRRGRVENLIGTPIAVGSPLPATSLLEAGTLELVDLSRERGKVLLLSVILSVDTAV